MRSVKKLLTGTIVSGLLFSMAAIPCLASKSVKLTTDQYWNNSGAITAKETAFNGSASKNNPRKVYFIAEYKNSTGWHYNTKKLIGAGKQCPTLNSDKMSRRNWRLQLNPYGTDTSGCMASGKIWIVTQ